jgi:hypothetical protein
MILLNLKFLNRFCRKNIFSILVGFFTIFKKSTPSIIILSIILSLFGNNLINKCDNNIKDNETVISSNSSDKKWSDILKNKMNNVFSKNTDNKGTNSLENFVKQEEYLDTDETYENTGTKNDYNSIHKENNNNINNESININDKINNKMNISKNINKINLKVKNKPLIKNNNDKWHDCKINNLYKNYNVDKNEDFKLVVSDSNKQLLIQNLRTYANIDFYFKFYISEYDNKKINDLMMLKDIQSWMTNCTISNDDFKNTCIPVYIIVKDYKTENEIMVFEIYKMFFYEKEEGVKHCFISKGTNWTAVQEITNILHNFGYVKDILNGKDYDTYNLANNNELCAFLDNLLSVYMLSGSKKDDVVYLDMNENCDNKETYDYLYHNANSDTNMIQIDTLTTI